MCQNSLENLDNAEPPRESRDYLVNFGQSTTPVMTPVEAIPKGDHLNRAAIPLSGDSTSPQSLIKLAGVITCHETFMQSNIVSFIGGALIPVRNLNGLVISIFHYSLSDKLHV